MTVATRRAALQRLRHRLEKIEKKSSAKRSVVPCALQHGVQNDASGLLLPYGALSEVRCADWRDAPAAAAFSFVLAGRRARAESKAILFLQLKHAAREYGAPFARALPVQGIGLSDFFVAFARDEKTLLWAAEEATRCRDLAAVIAEIPRASPLLDLTATRRLQLAVASSGVSALLLRTESVAAPTAAFQRWRVRAAPSAPNPHDASAPGFPRWRVDIERCRKGGRPSSPSASPDTLGSPGEAFAKPGGAWLLEWRYDEGELILLERTISGDLGAGMAGGPAEEAA